MPSGTLSRKVASFFAARLAVNPPCTRTSFPMRRERYERQRPDVVNFRRISVDISQVGLSHVGHKTRSCPCAQHSGNLGLYPANNCPCRCTLDDTRSGPVTSPLLPNLPLFRIRPLVLLVSFRCLHFAPATGLCELIVLRSRFPKTTRSRLRDP